MQGEPSLCCGGLLAKDEREEEEPLGFGVRPYMFETVSTASSAAEPAERERES